MTTTDHNSKTTPTEDATSRVRDRDRTLVNAGNIATAVCALGASVALGVLLPLPVYKVIIGGAAVVVVVSLGKSVYRWLFKPETPAVEEASDGR